MFCVKFVFSSPRRWLLSMKLWLKRFGAFLIEFIIWRTPDRPLLVRLSKLDELNGALFDISRMVGITDVWSFVVTFSAGPLSIFISEYGGFAEVDSFFDDGLCRNDKDFKRLSLLDPLDKDWFVGDICRSSRDETSLSNAVKSAVSLEFWISDEVAAVLAALLGDNPNRCVICGNEKENKSFS